MSALGPVALVSAAVGMTLILAGLCLGAIWMEKH
jgi:hypothetical protein